MLDSLALAAIRFAPWLDLAPAAIAPDSLLRSSFCLYPRENSIVASLGLGSLEGQVLKQRNFFTTQRIFSCLQLGNWAGSPRIRPIE